jgi:hypothetical protein
MRVDMNASSQIFEMSFALVRTERSSVEIQVTTIFRMEIKRLGDSDLR